MKEFAAHNGNEIDLNNRPDVRVIHTLEELQQIEQDWYGLLDRLGVRSPFLSPPWIALCAKYLAAGECMRILSMWRGRDLLGLIPMMESSSRMRGFPVRQLRSLLNPLAGYSEILACEPQAFIEAVLDYLSAEGHWQIVTFDRIREGSSGLAALKEAVARRNRFTMHSEVSRTPYLEIQGTLEEFWSGKSAKFRKTRRSISNRIEKLGGVRVECITGDGREEAALQEFLELSRKSWTRTEGRDLLAEDFERRFLEDLTKLAVQKGWLRFWFLRKEEELIAAEYHLRDGHTEYGLRAHYDPAYSYQSPGTFLDVSVVKRLFADGCKVYDMGPGLVSYKAAWTTTAYACSSISLFGPGVYAGFLGRLESEWIPAARKTSLGRWLASAKRPAASAEPAAAVEEGE
jgi:CelD/BcsL family acetyltransferase involved in cellulose biosynthesis